MNKIDLDYIVGFIKEFTQKIDGLEKSHQEIKERLDNIEKRFNNMEKRFNNIEKRLNNREIE